MVAKNFLISQKDTTGKIGYYEVSSEDSEAKKLSETVQSIEQIAIKSNENQLLQANDQSSLLLTLVGICLLLVSMLLLIRRNWK